MKTNIKIDAAVNTTYIWAVIEKLVELTRTEPGILIIRIEDGEAESDGTQLPF